MVDWLVIGWWLAGGWLVVGGGAMLPIVAGPKLTSA
jgi:hypothetical protein